MNLVGWKIHSDLDNKDMFAQKILNKDYKIIKVLKDDKRSYVVLINIMDNRLVLKIPREKNTRKWQRFINGFRGSDSLRSYKMMNNLKKIGIKSTEAVLAMEKRKNGLIIDSYLLMKYLNGKEIQNKYYLDVIKTLNSIHDKGYLHGDSQIQNFMSVEDEIYSIDLRLQKNIYGQIGRDYEFIYLRESCKEIEKLYGDRINTVSYKIANYYKQWLYFHGYLRKIIKRKNRGR